MNGMTIRTVSALRLEHTDGIRTAVVVCPWCNHEHTHVVPLGLVVGARIERSPRCDARRGVYTIEIPESAR